MSEQQDDLLRTAARAWIEATERLDQLAGATAATSEVMEAADAATLARMRFHQTLARLGWTPPTSVPEPSE